MIHIANYGRKSVYSDRSDSVDNQFRMCREYVAFKFPDSPIETYSDEGFTGANTDRPGLQRLMEDVKAGLVDALIVYQLDRLSRDVKDFANIYSVLEERGVMFISIKENIDTTTPIGKAMMYVTMVFAQMEREQIATRVIDNMHGLARKGYWPIGTVPAGYKRKKIEVGGKKHSTLEIDPEGAEFVKSLYRDFLDSPGSVASMETAYRKEGVKTPNGCFLAQGTIYKYLTTPFYCQATPEMYDYWKEQGCQMAEESPRDAWDGSCGVMVYGRRHNKNGRTLQPKEEWIVSLGMHPWIIPASDWLTVQDKFTKNTFNKTMKYDIPLLKGVVRCAKCGSRMSVSRKKNKYGVASFYYCTKRDRFGSDVCDMKALKCELLDNRVLEVFSKIEADPNVIIEYTASKKPADNTEKLRGLERKAQVIRSRIQRLTESLADGSGASKYIIKQIEEEDLSLDAINREIEMAKSEARRAENEELSEKQKAEDIRRMMQTFDGVNTEERNRIAKAVIQECTWDGEGLFLRL